MAEEDWSRNQAHYPITPDPSPLTTAQILREIASLKELVFTRLDAMDKAMELFNANITRVPTDVDKQVGTLQALVYETFKTIDVKLMSAESLFAEQFDSVAQQFKERDTRSERESRDNKVAVDAAFAAQKEAASEQNKSNTLAIDKSEKATAETLNKQADLFKSTTDALDEKIGSNKELSNRMDSRLTAIESRGVVVREAQVQTNWGTSTIVAIIATLISLSGLIVVVLVKVG